MEATVIEIEIGKVNAIDLKALELKVLIGLAKGKGVAGMAAEGYGSHSSVMKAKNRMYNLFNVKSEVMLVHAAVLNGIIKLEIR